MDLAFIFTFLVLRCLSIEAEICALSISMRQTALGNLGPLFAAMAGVEDNRAKMAEVSRPVNAINVEGVPGKPKNGGG